MGSVAVENPSVSAGRRTDCITTGGNFMASAVDIQKKLILLVRVFHQAVGAMSQPTPFRPTKSLNE